MKLHKISITIMIMGMLILAITTFITDLGDNYGAGNFEGLPNTEAALNSQINVSEDLKDQIEIITLQKNTDSNLLMIPYALIKAGWDIAKTIFGPWFTFGAVLSDISNSTSDLGVPLPEWLITSIIAIMFTILAAILVFAFFKWKFED